SRLRGELESAGEELGLPLSRIAVRPDGRGPYGTCHRATEGAGTVSRSQVIDSVLLDIDGTLLYSNDEHTRAFLLAAEKMGIHVPSFEEVRRLIGMGGDKLIPRVFGFAKESAEGREL